jgi:amidophosphoribosyltransferase
MSGLFGYFRPKGTEAAEHVFLGLYALQHRGQESAGIAVSDTERIRIHKGMGLVANVFTSDILERLPGSIGLGHVRYSTLGTAHAANAQPLMAFSRFGQIAVAHNGSLTNSHELQQNLLISGALFQTSTDCELILNLIAQYPEESLKKAVSHSVKMLKGSYALIVMSKDQLIGVRDPFGNRPLSIGKLQDRYLLASESCAFSTLGAELIREVKPGEMVVIDKDGIQSEQVISQDNRAFCVFEYVYFARQDTEFGKRNVHLIREEIGKVLAREHPLKADVVIPAPDSAISAAMGYSKESGIPYELGLVKNRYVGRTFIQPTPTQRELGVQIKLNPIHQVLKGKRVILLDDSIVRGTTTAKAIQMLRDAGAKEVHMMVASPPFVYTCHYGIDVPTVSELIASSRTVDEVCRLIGADSLHYISYKGLCQAVGIEENSICTSCFTGIYPIKIEKTAPDLLEGIEIKVD